MEREKYKEKEREMENEKGKGKEKGKEKEKEKEKGKGKEKEKEKEKKKSTKKEVKPVVECESEPESETPSEKVDPSDKKDDKRSTKADVDSYFWKYFPRPDNRKWEDVRILISPSHDLVFRSSGSSSLSSLTLAHTHILFCQLIQVSFQSLFSYFISHSLTLIHKHTMSDYPFDISPCEQAKSWR